MRDDDAPLLLLLMMEGLFLMTLLHTHYKAHFKLFRRALIAKCLGLCFPTLWGLSSCCFVLCLHSYVSCLLVSGLGLAFSFGLVDFVVRGDSSEHFIPFFSFIFCSRDRHQHRNHMGAEQSCAQPIRS